MSVGLLFPGQGSQFVGMGKDLAERFPVARMTFEEADDTLGFSLSSLCWNGPDSELTLTKNAQPAILVHSIVVWRLLAVHESAVALAAGHSLGEFSAYVATGSIGFADAVRTVRRRGELMYRSGEVRPGAMAAVLGLHPGVLEQACRESSTATEAVVPANYNDPMQIVISGDTAAVTRAGELAIAAGAKRVVPLNVSGAFHSPLMATAADGLKAELDGIRIHRPCFPVVSNVTSRPVRDEGDVRRLLVEQLTAPVRWTQSVEAMVELGVSEFLEIGPANVLTKMLRRIAKQAHGRALGTATEVQTFLEEES